MPRLEIRPFSAEFLAAAGELLAKRHQAHRAAEPLLPAQYEDAATARAEVEALLASDGASGATALRNGRVVGYLLGLRKSDEIWGANVWVELAGHAVEEPEDLRDLYAAAAQGWVDDDVRTRHYALVPATDQALVGSRWRRTSTPSSTSIRSSPTIRRIAGVRARLAEGEPGGVARGDPRRPRKGGDR